MKKNFIIAVLIMTIISCQKKTTSKDLYLRGRLFLTDTTSQHFQNRPLARTTVYISDADPAANPNYLQSVKTDDDGYFVFSLDPKSARDYYVSAEHTANGLKFNAMKHVMDSNNIAMILGFDESSQNGLSIRLKDTNNAPFPNQIVNVYNSLVVAQLDDTLGSNAFKKDTSDDFGRITLFNLQQGTYYLSTRKRFGAAVIGRKFKTVELGKSGIARDTMLLK